MLENFCTLGEGPHWSEAKQCLYFVDILEGKVIQYNPDTEKATTCKVRTMMNANNNIMPRKRIFLHAHGMLLSFNAFS